jgi:biopolymer transport protein ExbB/TolQ
MNVPVFLAAAAGNANKAELLYVWEQATPEAKVIIVCLAIFSIIAWSVMIAKALQMRRATRLNQLFNAEYRTQKNVLDVYDRRVQADGCPMFMVYQAGSVELDTRLKNPDGNGRKRFVSLKGIAVSGAPFLGLLGTVWGVMSTFGHIAQQGSATMAAMAPGVAAALITTVAGLLVAIPSMFGYNWLVHNLRVLTVQLDNFAQDLVSKMETEYLEE